MEPVQQKSTAQVSEVTDTPASATNVAEQAKKKAEELQRQAQQLQQQAQQLQQEATKDTPQTPQDRKVNITQLVPWLSIATANNKGFLIKPNDMKVLYLLVLWQYISNHHHTGDASTDAKPIPEDAAIALPEAEVARLVQLMYHKSYYPFFDKIFNM